ncbi:sulfite exporter TauE/SafE family protein [Phytoactinopolyspora limicola]|uniref:sulfite exporter TauE/SafE family protein n=1 Tax=Phytoactinopolyspora limicola TaxID=2715536 RepID=UPI001407A93B|nr:sulfite exporter TauE/SafE family protein [Phytoactinopolyspora limicola]
MDLTFWILTGGAVLLGAAVQGSVGLGLGLVAAPVVTLLDPTLMPGAMLVTTAALPVLSLSSEWRHADLRGLSWALVGRFVGTIGGVWVVAALAPNTLALAVGIMVLVAVALTVFAVRVRSTPTTLTAAGVISGVTGTATSIGGPPVALVYQHDPGPRVRSTLAVYFLIGTLVSLGALAIGGQLHEREVWVGLGLFPFIIAGYLIARPLRRVVDGGHLRAALLVVVTISGLVLIAQSAFMSG